MNNYAVKILIRQTEDWANLKTDPIHCLKLPDQQKTFLECVDKWNETFDLKYNDFRAELKAIAKTTWPKIPISHFNGKFEPNTLYLVTDDDDWFAPGIVEYITERYDGRQLVCWRSPRLHSENGVFRFDDWTDHEVGSNSYAVRVGEQNIQKLVCAHHLLPTDLTFNKVLSLYIRHPASLHYLVHLQGTLEIPPPVWQDFPEELQWAVPHARRLFTLLQNLNTSRRFHQPRDNHSVKLTEPVKGIKA